MSNFPNILKEASSLTPNDRILSDAADHIEAQDARIRELEAANIKLQNDCYSYEKTMQAIALADAGTEAYAQKLREALESLLPSPLCGEAWELPDTETVEITITFGNLKLARKTLSLTPSSALAAVRDEVREECAKIADDIANEKQIKAATVALQKAIESEPFFDYEDAVRLVLTAAEQAQEAQPVAYSYEYAHYIKDDGTFTGWLKQVTFPPPYTARGNVRNIQPLYTAPTIPAGWQIVPMEPTREMVGSTVDEVFDGAIEDASIIEIVYKAMLSAAPKAQASQEQRNE